MKMFERSGYGLSRLLVITLFLALVLSLSGIGRAAFAQEPPKADPGEAVEEGEGAFHYIPMGRRDPFKSLMIQKEIKKDYTRLPPIQQTELKSFKVLGIIMDEERGHKAMVKAPDGKTYVLKKGNIIGKNEGEVVSIDLNGITVEEKFLDYMDAKTTVPYVMTVSDKKE